MKVREIEGALRAIGSKLELDKVETVKNNVKLKGLCIRNPENNTSIIYYPNEGFDKIPLIQQAKLIEEWYVEHYAGPFDVTRIISPEYILGNVLPAVASETNRDNFDDAGIFYVDTEIDMITYFRVVMDEEDDCDGFLMSYILHRDLIDKIGLLPADVINAAMDNLNRQIDILDLAEILDMDFDDVEPCILVVTNKSRMYGASAIVSGSVLNTLKSILGTDIFVVLPSSIHEILVLPVFTNDYDTLVEMVREVNSTQVAEEDRLTDNIYIYKNNTLEVYTGN